MNILWQKQNFNWVFWLLSFWLGLWLWSIFSYALTTPNLILSSWSIYWDFQWWMWQELLANKQLLVSLFLILITLLWITYLKLISSTNSHQIVNSTWRKLTTWQQIKIYLLLISPLLLSMNGLSNDVFNYMFNAKMVVSYHANPHVLTALDFPEDDWLRFMHNVHTPAPYGYGWTGLSIFPYILSLGKLLPGWLIFRCFSILSLVSLWFSLNHLAKSLNKHISLTQRIWLFANPLVLIEIVGNQHNDLWMLIPAICSISLVIRAHQAKSFWKLLFLSALLLMASIAIKLATIVIVPIWILLAVRPGLKNWITNILRKKSRYLAALSILGFDFVWEKFLNIMPLLASMTLFLPLFSTRSQQFLPWYITWSLVWLPFINWQPWRLWLLGFSFSGLLRYLPWLYAGGYSLEILNHQKIYLWLIPSGFVLLSMIIKPLYNKSHGK